MFWKDKKVLVTGHTGFKGSWLALWLLKMNAIVSGISLNPDEKQNLFDQLKFSLLLQEPSSPKTHLIPQDQHPKTLENLNRVLNLQKL